jgi:hypothetical protein
MKKLLEKLHIKDINIGACAGEGLLMLLLGR